MISSAFMVTGVYDTRKILLYSFTEKENLDVSLRNCGGKKLLSKKKVSETVSLKGFVF